MTEVPLIRLISKGTVVQRGGFACSLSLVLYPLLHYMPIIQQWRCLDYRVLRDLDLESIMYSQIIRFGEATHLHR